MKYLLLIIATLPSFALATASTCYGNSSAGRIENASQLPAKGKNFVVYSHIARIAGRTYVHSEVAKIITSAYADLASEHPLKVYKYAETGLKHGGTFKPHKTHKNGLSVDFMTPVTDKTGQSVHLPTHAFNRFGYDIEFDQNDHFNGMHIDYSAMAAHIVALHKQAKKHGYDLWRVIFDPKLQPKLYQTAYAEYLKKHIQFSSKRSWVRHDEHYHVDFAIPCKSK